MIINNFIEFFVFVLLVWYWRRTHKKPPENDFQVLMFVAAYAGLVTLLAQWLLIGTLEARAELQIPATGKVVFNGTSFLGLFCLVYFKAIDKLQPASDRSTRKTDRKETPSKPEVKKKKQTSSPHKSGRKDKKPATGRQKARGPGWSWGMVADWLDESVDNRH